MSGGQGGHMGCFGPRLFATDQWILQATDLLWINAFNGLLLCLRQGAPRWA